MWLLFYIIIGSPFSIAIGQSPPDTNSSERSFQHKRALQKKDTSGTDQEKQEARERAARERWILEERARGYEPTRDEYQPAVIEERIDR